MSCWELAWHMAGYKQCTCPTLIDTANQFSKVVSLGAVCQGAKKSRQRVKKKKKKKQAGKSSRNVQCLIVKSGCYGFSHVHEFEILPWVRLAYSCLKFPATNGM